MSNGELDPRDLGDDLQNGTLEDVLVEEEGIQVRRGTMIDGSIKTQIELDPRVFVQLVPVVFQYNKAADRMIFAWKRAVQEGGGVSRAAGNGKCKR